MTVSPSLSARPLFRGPSFRVVAAAGILFLSASTLFAGPPISRLSGAVRDRSGVTVAGAAVAVIRPDGRVRVAVTDAAGRYAVTGLEPGRYAVWAYTKGYGLYENSAVHVKGAAGQVLNIRLPDESNQKTRALHDMSSAADGPSDPFAWHKTPAKLPAAALY
jgi:Carboxypeptidase regulatory-like domain